jgi:hypothetical protein
MPANPIRERHLRRSWSRNLLESCLHLPLEGWLHPSTDDLTNDIFANSIGFDD